MPTLAARPRYYAVIASVFRIVGLTFLITLLAFAVGLFVGVVVLAVANIARGGGINMTAAYRHIALPVAGVAFAAGFVTALLSEIRWYRRSRT
jgi:hypothetical protein